MGKLKNKLNYFKDYFKYLKNPLSALLFKFGLKRKCNVKIKNSNEHVDLTSINVLNKIMAILPFVKNDKLSELINYIQSIDNDDEFVFIDNIKYYNTLNTLFKKKYSQDFHHGDIILEEYFYDDDWDVINFKDRFVIDIGANCADRTLHFAKHGAKVIGFEPVKHVYKLGLDNISLNPSLKKNISFINKAVGGGKGKLAIGDLNSSEEYVAQNEYYEIEIITITDVLNDYNFTPDVLKMDCEGCEFEIILNEDLSMFNDIIFEHHSLLTGKDYNILIEKLRKENFKINRFTVGCGNNFDELGIIHAYK